MEVKDLYPLAKTLPGGWFSEYDMEAICPALEAIPENGLYLEVGVHKGTSLAFARAVTKPSVSIWGIDKEDTIDRDWFLGKQPEVNFYHSSSNEAVKNWDKPIDVLFIDGDHSYEGCLDDWNNFSPFVKKGGIVFFHDCDATSPGVEQVFKKIKKGWGHKTFYIKKLGGRKTSMTSVVKL